MKRPIDYSSNLTEDVRKKILEYNKLIATYMGYTYFPSGEGVDPGWKRNRDVQSMSKFNLKEDDFLCRSHNQLAYHYDWNSLIPVITELYNRHEFIVYWIMNGAFAWHTEDFKMLKSNAMGKPKYWSYATYASVPEDAIIAVWDVVALTVEHIMKNMDPKIPQE